MLNNFLGETSISWGNCKNGSSCRTNISKLNFASGRTAGPTSGTPVKLSLKISAIDSKNLENFLKNLCNAGYRLPPRAFGESLGRELHETRLCECDSLHSCQELSIHKRREQCEGVQTRASENKEIFVKYCG